MADCASDTRCPASIVYWLILEASRQRERERAHSQKRRPSAGVQSGLLAAECGAGIGTLGITHRALALALALATLTWAPCHGTPLHAAASAAPPSDRSKHCALCLATRISLGNHDSSLIQYLLDVM